MIASAPSFAAFTACFGRADRRHADDAGVLQPRDQRRVGRAVVAGGAHAVADDRVRRSGRRRARPSGSSRRRAGRVQLLTRRDRARRPRSGGSSPPRGSRSAPALLAAAVSSGVATQPMPVCMIGQRTAEEIAERGCARGRREPARRYGARTSRSRAPLGVEHLADQAQLVARRRARRRDRRAATASAKPVCCDDLVDRDARVHARRAASRGRASRSRRRRGSRPRGGGRGSARHCGPSARGAVVADAARRTSTFATNTCVVWLGTQ